jgi:hypothetical protein
MYQQRQVRAHVTVGVNPADDRASARAAGAGGANPLVEYRDLGIADKWEGGDGDSDIATYDSSAGRIILGGNQTREDGTATYLVTEAFWEHWLHLDRYRGKLPCTVTLVPVGDDDTPFAGGAATFTGYVKTVPMPRGDFGSNEGNAVGIVLALDAERAATAA